MHMWPTPTASNSNEGETLESWSARREKIKDQKKNGNGFGMPLAIAVRMYPTPTASTGGVEPPGETGRKLTTVVGGLLNPDWIEWLMNWPIGWTALAPLSEESFKHWENNKSWYDKEPDIKRTVDKKLENRTSRIKALGNGQVPAVAVMAWQILSGAA